MAARHTGSKERCVEKENVKCHTQEQQQQQQQRDACKEGQEGREEKVCIQVDGKLTRTYAEITKQTNTRFCGLISVKSRYARMTVSILFDAYYV